MKNKKPDLNNFYEAWHWLSEHPYFFHANPLWSDEPGFAENLSIFVYKKSIGLECGPFLWEPIHKDADAQELPAHDYKLDVYGKTFEKAIIKLAKRVMKKHGDYPEYRRCSSCMKNLPAGKTDLKNYWYCSKKCKEKGPYIAKWLKKIKKKQKDDENADS